MLVFGRMAYSVLGWELSVGKVRSWVVLGRAVYLALGGGVVACR